MTSKTIHWTWMFKNKLNNKCLENLNHSLLNVYDNNVYYILYIHKPSPLKIIKVWFVMTHELCNSALSVCDKWNKRETWDIQTREIILLLILKQIKTWTRVPDTIPTRISLRIILRLHYIILLRNCIGIISYLICLRRNASCRDDKQYNIIYLYIMWKYYLGVGALSTGSDVFLADARFRVSLVILLYVCSLHFFRRLGK